MADKTIGELQLAAEVYDNSLFVAEQSGSAVKIEGLTFKNYAKQAASTYADQALASATSASESADTAQKYSGNPPIIEAGTWWTWNAAQQEYIDTGEPSTGETGAVGPTGPTNTLSIGAVQSGASADASITGTAPTQVLNLTLPKGEKGDRGEKGETGNAGSKGDTGAQGPVGPPIQMLGTYVSLPALEVAVPNPNANDMYNVGAAAPYNIYRWTGVDWEDQGTLQGPKGDDGAPGADGVDASGAEAEVIVSSHNSAADAHASLFGAKADKGESFGVTLSVAGWSGNAQTVSNAKLLTGNYAYIVCPDGDSFAAYGEAIIYADDITTSGQMTFRCSETPTAALSVNILRTEANE